MKRFLSLIMVLMLLLSAPVFVACADDGPVDDPNGGNGNSSGTGDEAGRIELVLPDVNYRTSAGAAPYHILEWSANGIDEVGVSWIPWEEGDVDDLDGDMLGKAVFNRNSSVEEKFGVEITKEYVSVDKGYMDRVRQNAAVSANEFQLLTQRTLDIVTLVDEDLMYDMNEVAGTILHTDQPWWVQDAVASFTLGSHLYVCATEMLLRDKGATAVAYFNQDIAEDYSEVLPDFFELADNGEWTMEVMIEAAESVASSLDGDQEMNSARDMWGVYGGDDPVFHLYAGAGKRFAHIDEAGFMVYDFGDDPETITIMQDIHEDFMYNDWYLLNTVNDIKMSDGKTNVFVGGQSLFYMGGLVKDTALNLKKMTDTYGILPTPMFDVDQEGYHSLVWIHQDSVLGIPAHNDNPEMSAVILEALSWEAYYSVYPIFYDTILLDRAAKDEESKRMLEIAFATRMYDPGLYWDNKTGLLEDGGLWRYCQTGGTDIASIWGRFEVAVADRVKEINRMIEGFDE